LMHTDCVYDWENVNAHRKEGSAWVVLKGKVYDITQFVERHPGGKEAVLPYLGKDITGAFAGEEGGHVHSDAALGIIKQYQIGTMLNNFDGMADHAEEDDLNKQYGIDMSKPLVTQMPTLGNDYIKYVHQPQYCTPPAKMFGTPWIEMFAATPWWLVPLIWIPQLAAEVWYSVTQLGTSPQLAMQLWFLGLMLWPCLEYALHRFLFHLTDRYVLLNKYTIMFHYIMHGVHHHMPMDPGRLVFPPVLTTIVKVAVYMAVLPVVQNVPLTMCIVSGITMGYVCYDVCHYAVHHFTLPTTGIFGHVRRMKTYHLNHHYKNYSVGYGITCKVLDRLFGTLLE